jgi:hypothetical protein
MTSTDLATTAASDIVGTDAEAELSRQAGAGLDEQPVLPLVNLSQGLSKVVQEGEVPIGHYFNSLTSFDYGEELEFVVAFKTKGRFYSNEDAGTFVAFGDVAPPNWPERFVGKRFDELPEAEEVHSARANDPEDSFEWGKGPAIQTTWNFVGFVPGEDQPVRFSFKSTAKAAAKKIHSITDWAPSLWSNVVKLSVRKTTNRRDQDYYVPVAAQGRATEPAERQRAVTLAQTIQGAFDRLQFVGDTDERREERKAVEAKAENALEVS